MFNRIGTHSIDMDKLVKLKQNIEEDLDFHYISTLEEEFDMLGLISDEAYRPILNDLHRGMYIGEVRSKYKLESNVRPHFGTLQDIRRAFIVDGYNNEPIGGNGNLKLLESEGWIDIDMESINSVIDFRRAFNQALKLWSAKAYDGYSKTLGNAILVGCDMRIPNNSLNAVELVKPLLIQLMPRADAEVYTHEYVSPKFGTSFIHDLEEYERFISLNKSKIQIKFRTYSVEFNTTFDPNVKNINALLPRELGIIGPLDGGDAFRRIDANGKLPTDRMVDKILGSFNESESDVSDVEENILLLDDIISKIITNHSSHGVNGLGDVKLCSETAYKARLAAPTVRKYPGYLKSVMSGMTVKQARIDCNVPIDYKPSNGYSISELARSQDVEGIVKLVRGKNLLINLLDTHLDFRKVEEGKFEATIPIHSDLVDGFSDTSLFSTRVIGSDIHDLIKDLDVAVKTTRNGQFKFTIENKDIKHIGFSMDLELLYITHFGGNDVVSDVSYISSSDYRFAASEYEVKLHKLFTRLNPHTQIMEGITPYLLKVKVMINHRPGLLSRLIYRRHTVNLSKITLPGISGGELEEVTNFLISKFDFSPRKLSSVSDVCAYVEYLRSKYVMPTKHATFAMPNVEKSKSMFSGMSGMGSMGRTHQPPTERPGMCFGESVSDNPTFSSPGEFGSSRRDNDVERYHLVTSSFGHDGMLLDMHYYVEATSGEAELLDRNYWLTRDEAIRRLSKFHEQLRSLNGGDTPTHRFRGPNFIHYGKGKTVDLVLTDHDAKQFTLKEAVGPKSKLLIDIYEEHFGMDMIVATTGSETYYCKTINIADDDTVNVIGFDDLLSVIPDNVDCSFGKRTLYGFKSEPVELTPKQFYRKMIELNK